MRFGLILTSLIALSMAAGCDKEELLPGERLDIYTGEPVATRAASNIAASVALPAPTNSDNWTHRAAGPDHDIGHRAFSTAPQLLWKADIGRGNGRKHRITADPVVAGSRVFTVDSRALVSAHGLDGAPLWSTDITPSVEGRDDASGAGLAYGDGQLFVTSGFGLLAALDAETGAVRWTQFFDAAPSGPPTVSGGLVFVATHDARLWAIETGRGRVRWSLDATPGDAGVISGAAPAINGELVVAPFNSAEVRGLLASSGAGVWATTVAGTRAGQVYASVNDISADPVVAGGRVYVGSAAGRMAALDADSGQQLWHAADGAISAVTVAGGALFAVTDKAELVRLNAADGTRVWAVELPLFRKDNRVRRRKDIFAHFGPVLAGGRLWVASDDDLLRSFDPTDGALLSEVALPGGATTNPALAGGTMYLVNAKGQLLAFR